MKSYHSCLSLKLSLSLPKFSLQFTGYERNDFLKRLTIHLPFHGSHNQVQPKNYPSAQKRVRIFLKGMPLPMLKIIKESGGPKVGHPSFMVDLTLFRAHSKKRSVSLGLLEGGRSTGQVIGSRRM